ncbi:beta-1,3-galactosyltransferase 5-like [Convolutriloba macropyga]|uniref:beta-1,3-galactosyltransferase 5-like n=1 Tax=Convolutriloba macropyga TaxID=536237 RepID=UPI003F523C16
MKKAKPYFYKENRNLCNLGDDTDDLVLIIVPSRVKDVEKRVVVRNTWASDVITGGQRGSRLSWKYILAFMIGLPSTDKDMLMIETESDVWGDIVGLNLRDHYTNLTVHTLLAFSWADRFCNESRMIYKADDDAYLNLANLERAIEAYPREQYNLSEEMLDLDTGLYQGGDCTDKNAVFRKAGRVVIRKKWVVARQEYPSIFWPLYCKGAFYFISSLLLSNISRNCPFHCVSQTDRNQMSFNCFWKFEDIHISSCLASFRPTVTFININEVFWHADVTKQPKFFYYGIGVIHPLKGSICFIFLKKLICHLVIHKIVNRNTKDNSYKSSIITCQ